MPFRVILYCWLLACCAGCTSIAQVNKPAETNLREGDELYRKKDYEDAIARWKKVKESSNASRELNSIVDLKIADAQFENKNYIEASASYENFRKFHPNNANAPYALFRVGFCNYNQIIGIDTDQTPVTNAVEAFESFLRQYPTSEYAVEAREKLADCFIKQVQYEIYIGRFYLRFGKYSAAVKRLEECLDRYPQSPILDEALFYLEKAYFFNNEKEKGKVTYNRLLIRFPTSKYLKEAGKYLRKYD